MGAEIEILVEQRDELRAQITKNNPANAELKAKVEKVNEQIRAIVARQDAEEDRSRKGG